MAGFISKAKTLCPTTKPNFMSLTLRHRSSRAATNPHLIEIDTSSSSLSSSEGEHEMTLKLFDDLIHRILVKKATPDWLPFVPGSSFWVPPRPTPSNVFTLVHKLTNDGQQVPASNDESLSISSLRGWPSSNYFIKGSFLGILFDFLLCCFFGGHNFALILSGFFLGFWIWGIRVKRRKIWDFTNFGIFFP